MDTFKTFDVGAASHRLREQFVSRVRLISNGCLQAYTVRLRRPQEAAQRIAFCSVWRLPLTATAERPV